MCAGGTAKRNPKERTRRRLDAVISGEATACEAQFRPSVGRRQHYSAGVSACHGKSQVAVVGLRGRWPSAENASFFPNHPSASPRLSRTRRNYALYSLPSSRRVVCSPMPIASRSYGALSVYRSSLSYPYSPLVWIAFLAQPLAFSSLDAQVARYRYLSGRIPGIGNLLRASACAQQARLSCVFIGHSILYLDLLSLSSLIVSLRNKSPATCRGSRSIVPSSLHAAYGCFWALSE